MIHGQLTRLTLTCTFSWEAEEKIGNENAFLTEPLCGIIGKMSTPTAFKISSAIYTLHTKLEEPNELTGILNLK